jgi:hypothetical protein
MLSLIPGRLLHTLNLDTIAIISVVIVAGPA